MAESRSEDRRRYVLRFDEPGADDIAVVGGKGANLARLVAEGFPVPAGFCVTAQAYRDHLAQDELGEAVLERVGGLGGDPSADPSLAEACSAARRLVRSKPIAPAIAAAISAGYEALGAPAVRVAVRSSATAEDLPEASFAGQQDTYLNVRGVDALLEHVLRCWASLWSERATAYRVRQGFNHEDVALAVVVQKMVEAEVAGVSFTANPVNGRRDQTIVNASFGLGEAVVSGLVTPDTYIVQHRDGVVRSREIAGKELEIVYRPEGAVESREIEDERKGEPSLSDEQAVQLAALGQRVADYYGVPQDIEWALKDETFYLLQSRPITTLGAAPEVDPDDHWTRAMFVEILPDAPSPVFCSVLEPLVAHMLDWTFERLGMEPDATIRASAVYYHQPYLNLRYVRSALSSLPRETGEALSARFANPFAESSPGHRRSGLSLAELRLAWRTLSMARQLPKQLDRAIARYYATLAPYRSTDPGALSRAEQVAAVEDMGLRLLPPLVAHDFLLLISLSFVQRLVAASVNRSGVAEPERIRAQLLSGITGNLTMETNKRLWQLAQAARAMPGVAEALSESPDESVLDRVRAAPGGAGFTAVLDAFLEDYGHREVRMDIAYPTWSEDPLPVLRFVRTYLAAESAVDPSVQERALADRRRAAAEEIAAALGRTLRGRLALRPIFRWAVGRAEALAKERDTMHFHWTASFPVLRRYLRALGEAWMADGVLDRRSDIYYLKLEELRRLVSEPVPMQEAAARRKDEWERDSKRLWPVEIRAAEELYHDETGDWELGRESLRGVAGSPGLATGPVRVVSGPEDFGRLAPGDVLVAHLTNPVWTPLFAIAAAIVTDTGGVLSHGAIVAREYGIPAVLGVRGATHALSDGQRVTVDGTRGTVSIEPDL